MLIISLEYTAQRASKSSLVTRAPPKVLDWIYLAEGVVIQDTALLRRAVYQTYV